MGHFYSMKVIIFTCSISKKGKAVGTSYILYNIFIWVIGNNGIDRGIKYNLLIYTHIPLTKSS